MFIDFQTVIREIIFTVFIPLVYIYIYFLIKDLDDPFDYPELGKIGGSDVSLEVLSEFISLSKNK